MKPNETKTTNGDAKNKGPSNPVTTVTTNGDPAPTGAAPEQAAPKLSAAEQKALFDRWAALSKATTAAAEALEKARDAESKAVAEIGAKLAPKKVFIFGGERLMLTKRGERYFFRRPSEEGEVIE